MAKFKIKGGTPLHGEIRVSGNKNSALPIIAATILTGELCRIENVPEIRDVHAMLELLKDLGKKVDHLNPNIYEISGDVNKSEIEHKYASRLRASILCLSGLLSRTGEVFLPPPGGCVIGRRNLDSHFDVAEAFGAIVKAEETGFRSTVNKINPANIFLKETSVTATENALILATATKGETIINNAASEPHIGDLVLVLRKMGAKIEGMGTNQLRVKGVEKVKGFHHSIIPDHIETGTFAIAAACTQSELIIKNAQKEHMIMTDYYLKQMGLEFEYDDAENMYIKPSRLISKVKKIQVGLWPGFPTDLLSPMIVLATQAEGSTLCHDWMYESRMFFVDKLILMGADIIQCDPHRVVVNGPTRLKGQELASPDIRAGIAMVIAALSAYGESIIDKVEIVDRGYEKIVERLGKTGATIERIEET
jgi:UDP-N-acetylglucosamine 1-carboxyvinyltransferase